MVSASATQQVSCNGGSNGQITATVAGGTAPYSYYLNGTLITTTSNTSYVFTGLSAGIAYTVSINDANNCGPATAAPITLTQPNSLMVSASATQQVSCNGGNNGQITATVAGGTAPYSYYLNGTLVTTISNTSYVFTGLAAGMYTVSVNDANNCGPATAPAITLTQPNSLMVSASATQQVAATVAVTVK